MTLLTQENFIIRLFVYVNSVIYFFEEKCSQHYKIPKKIWIVILVKNLLCMTIEINNRSQIVRAWVITQTVKRFLIISLVKLKIYKCKNHSFWACVLNKRVHITTDWLPIWRSIFIYIPQPKTPKESIRCFFIDIFFIQKCQILFEMWYEKSSERKLCDMDD